MLVAILGLVFVNFNATGVITFDYATLLKTQLSPHVEWLLMLGFFVAFAVKMPVVPVHSCCRTPTPRRPPPAPWTSPASS